MLRSLALSLAASTAAQFLHANQPTDPPSTHHLTNHPSTPAASSIPSRPRTPPVSLPLNASPSSLWTATFAHIPSSSAPLPSSTTTPHPHSIAILSSFSFFLSSTDNLRLHPRIRTLFLIRLLSPCPFPIYSSTLFSRTNVSSSFFPLFPLFCFFPADRARFFLRNKIIRRSFRARLTSLVLRVEEGESQVWFGRVSPLVQVLSGKRVEVGRGRRRKLELCWNRVNEKHNRFLHAGWLSWYSIIIVHIVTSFLSVTFRIGPISLKRADYVQVFEFDYSIRVLLCSRKNKRIAIVSLSKGQIGRAYTYCANGYRLFP